MKTKSLLLVFGLALAGLAAQSAAAQNKTDRLVTVESTHSYQQTVGNLKKDVSRSGMMVMAQVNQGHVLSMTGLRLNAALFLVGNPTVGKKLFEQNHGVGLYLPLRVFVYQGKDGKTFLSYDQPSAVLKQFNNNQIDMAANMLNQKLHGLAQMATH